MTNLEKSILDTKDGKKFQIIFVHPVLMRFILKLKNGDDLYNDLDELEDDMAKIVQADATYVVCLDPETGDSVVLPNKIIAESVLVIHEVK